MGQTTGAYLFGKDGDVFIEGLRTAHISTRYRGISGCACGQLTFFENESQKWEEGMPEIDIRDVLLHAITWKSSHTKTWCWRAARDILRLKRSEFINKQTPFQRFVRYILKTTFFLSDYLSCRVVLLIIILCLITIIISTDDFLWTKLFGHGWRQWPQRNKIVDENWRKTPQSKWADASLTNRVIYDALAAARVC